MLISETTCPRILHYLREIQWEAAFRSLVRQMSQVHAHLADRWNITARTSRTYQRIFDASDSLSCRACHGHLQLPPSAPGRPALNPVILGKACQLARRTNQYILERTAAVPEHVRLRSGPLLAEFVQVIGEHVVAATERLEMDQLEQVIIDSVEAHVDHVEDGGVDLKILEKSIKHPRGLFSSTSSTSSSNSSNTRPSSSEAAAAAPPKLVIYSGHDTTLGNFNSILQTGQYYWPPYAANVVVELWQRSPPRSDSWNAVEEEEDRDGDWQTIDDQSMDKIVKDWAMQDTTEMFHIRVLYNGKVVPLEWCSQPYTILSGSEERETFEGLCPLPLFLAHASQRISIDYAAECFGPVMRD